MQVILLKAAEPAGFVFWFLTELFFAGVVVFCLYYFLIKNHNNPGVFVLEQFHIQFL